MMSDGVVLPTCTRTSPVPAAANCVATMPTPPLTSPSTVAVTLPEPAATLLSASPDAPFVPVTVPDPLYVTAPPLPVSCMAAWPETVGSDEFTAPLFAMLTPVGVADCCSSSSPAPLTVLVAATVPTIGLPL